MLIGILDDLNTWGRENTDYLLQDVLPVFTGSPVDTGQASLTIPAGTDIVPGTDGAVTTYVPEPGYKKYVKPVLIGLAVFAGILILRKVILKKRRR